MNALELADELEAFHVDPDGFPYMIGEAINMLRQQQERLTKYELRNIAQCDRIAILEAQLKKASNK